MLLFKRVSKYVQKSYFISCSPSISPRFLYASLNAEMFLRSIFKSTLFPSAWNCSVVSAPSRFLNVTMMSCGVRLLNVSVAIPSYGWRHAGTQSSGFALSSRRQTSSVGRNARNLCRWCSRQQEDLPMCIPFFFARRVHRIALEDRDTLVYPQAERCWCPLSEGRV